MNAKKALFLIAFFFAATGCAGGRKQASAPEASPAAEIEEPQADLPSAYKQILPRGRIAAIDAPVFVSAAEAEIAPEAWVLGVVVDGEARAYSLNLLNRHEVVNDSVGDKSFAAVW